MEGSQAEELLVEVLKTCGWKKHPVKNLWTQRDIRGIWSSCNTPLCLNDAIHINNAMLTLMIDDYEETAKE